MLAEVDCLLLILVVSFARELCSFKENNRSLVILPVEYPMVRYIVVMADMLFPASELWISARFHGGLLQVGVGLAVVHCRVGVVAAL